MKPSSLPASHTDEFSIESATSQTSFGEYSLLIKWKIFICVLNSQQHPQTSCQGKSRGRPHAALAKGLKTSMLPENVQ